MRETRVYEDTDNTYSNQKLNELIAKHIFGWRIMKHNFGLKPTYAVQNGAVIESVCLIDEFNPTSSIEDLDKVVQQFNIKRKTHSVKVSKYKDIEYKVSIPQDSKKETDVNFCVYSHHMGRAICFAILLSLGVKF